MPGFDGNGNYIRYHNWSADAANNIDINAGEMDQEDSGFAGAFGNCITRDGQGKATADLNPNVTNSYNLGTVGLAWAAINGVPFSRLTSAGAGDIRNYGAISGTDCATAVANAASANSQVFFPLGSWVMATTPTIPVGVILTALPGSTFSGAGANNLGFTQGAIQQEIQEHTTALDFATHYFRRDATHSGGVSTNVSSCVNIATFASNTGITNNEWALTAVMHNGSAGGENVAAYMQGRKQSTGGWTWGAVIEVLEEAATNDPLTGTIGLELDVNCNGTDANRSRVAIDIAIRKTNAGGAAAHMGKGVTIQNGGNTDSVVDLGYGFDTGMQVGDAFYTHTATLLGTAFKMAQGQVIAFDANAVNQLSNQGSGLDYVVSGTLQTRLMSTGGLQVRNSQVVGQRSTGWGAMTGTLDNATAFNTASVTLAQLASRVAALQNAFTVHGLIGP